jgi:hypothetical protein
MTSSPTTRLPLPTFLIIGAQKSATRWLRYNLGLHPEVFVPSGEIWFFNNVAHRFSDLGVPWYREQFEGWSGEPKVGEATPGYMILRHDPATVARRIHLVVPDVRLIALLRNPVDRANSAMVHQIKRGRLPADSRLIELVHQADPAVRRMGFVPGSLYAASLEPYLDRFGDQLLVQLHDDIKSDARGVYQAALDHIGATQAFVPDSLEEVRESNQGGKRPSRKVSPEDRAELYEYFRDDVARLQDLIGRDLSMWDPANAPVPSAPGP